MLYLVPTPIGNLQDMTFRAVQTLKDVDLILAEDTRVSVHLFKHFGIETPYHSFHAHNEHQKLEKVLDSLKNGRNIAMVTDAGSPGISDPGFLLVRACVKEGIHVVPLPGPTALIPALAASGLPTDKFHFEGFLPVKKGRNTRLEFLKTYPHTLVLYESPYKLSRTVKDLSDHLGSQRMACIAKEISKIYESFSTDTLEAHVKRLSAEAAKVKGEYVIVVQGNSE